MLSIWHCRLNINCFVKVYYKKWQMALSRMFYERLSKMLGCFLANNNHIVSTDFLLTECLKFVFQKDSFRGVLRIWYSKSMQQIYSRTPMLKCDFSEVAHTTAWVFPCKFAAYFQNTFCIITPMKGCFWSFIQNYSL